MLPIDFLFPAKEYGFPCGFFLCIKESQVFDHILGIDESDSASCDADDIKIVIDFELIDKSNIRNI
jgi:hypothetical protein